MIEAARRVPGPRMAPYVQAVYQKELLEALRDRRTLLVMVLLPAVIMPLATLGIPYLEQRQARQFSAAVPAVAVVGQAPALIHLAYTTRLITPVRARDPLDALRQRQVLAVLRLPPGMEAAVARGGQVRAVIQFDASDAESVAAQQKVADLVGRYSEQIVARRMLARHINPQELTPVVVGTQSVATQRQLSRQLLAGLLPFFIAMWAVVGGMSVAVDLAAGEKERGTLEGLLVTPPSREALVLGKFCTVLTASVASVVIVVVAVMISLRWGARYLLPGASKLDVSLSFGSGVVLLGIAVLFSALVAAVQLALSIYARTPREAQQYFTPVYFATVLPAFAVQFISGWQSSPWVYLVPVLNAFFAFRELLLGTVHWLHLAFAAVSSLFYAAVVLQGAVTLFSRESVLFRV